MTIQGSNNKLEMLVTKAQKAHLEYLEGFGHGKLELDVKAGQPVGSRIVVKDGVVQQYIKFD